MFIQIHIIYQFAGYISDKYAVYVSRICVISCQTKVSTTCTRSKCNNLQSISLLLAELFVFTTAMVSIFIIFLSQISK